MTAPVERGHGREATPEERLAAARRRCINQQAVTRRLTRQRATLPWLVEVVAEDPDHAGLLADHQAEHRECCYRCDVTGQEGCPPVPAPGEPQLLDFDAWDPQAGEWGPDAPQRYATVEEALDRMAAEVGHPGGDWVRLQVRHAEQLVPYTQVDVVAYTVAAAALSGGAG